MKKAITLLSTLFLSGSLLAQQLPTQGLVAYFPFSNSAQDASGFNHNGTVYGATLTADRFGNANSAYHFNGTNQYISASGISTLNTANHTISVWVKAEQRNDALASPYVAHPGTPHYYPNNVISNDLANYSGHGLGLNVTSNFNELVTEYQSGFNSEKSKNLQANQWYNIVCRYQTGKLNVYINGVLAYSVNYTQDPYDGLNALNIGKHNEDAGYTTRRFFKGTIDDIRIYNRSLDSTEISQLYQNDTVSAQPTACQSINPINIQVSANQQLTASAGVTATYQWLLNGQPIAGATDSVYVPTQSGSYSVTYTSMYAPSFVYCTKTTPAVVFNDTTTSQPTACQSITPINIQVSANQQLTASAGVTATYQWLLNGQPIAGATDSVYVPTQSGSYSVTYTSMYAPSFVYCTKTTSAVVFSLTSNKTKINNLFKNYPNPTQGTMFVEATSSGKLSILDKVGKVILSQEIVAGKNEINLSAFAKGLYMLQLETKEGVGSSKISVE